MKKLEKLSLALVFLLINIFSVQAQTLIQKNGLPSVKNMTEILKSIEYPTELRETGTEGSVILRLWIDENGGVDKHSVESSSDLRLEEIIIDQISNFQISPATNIYGQSISSTVKIPFLFELDVN